jgi:hypothetical protein
MIDDYPMAGPMDIRLPDFATILGEQQSPAALEAGPMFQACLNTGVSPVTFLAFFRHESRYGTLGICHDYDTKNPGNVRSPEDPSLGEIIQTRGGPFAKYPTWENGAIDWGKRIQGPKYAGAGLTTVRGVLPRYAPTGDNNDPEAYIRSVLNFIDARGIPEVVSQQAATVTAEGAIMPEIIVDTPRPGQAAGVFAAQPFGVILHGSRGGASSVAAEYAGTAAWAVKNPDGLCWNATIGEGRYCVHLSARDWGWNARAESRDFLAVEFAQSRLASPISDAQVAAFAAWFTAEVEPVWPGLLAAGLRLPMHSELTSGAADGKSDAFLAGSANANNLRRRIMLALDINQASEDARMEEYYQEHAAELGEKKYAALLSLHYYQGKALVCEFGVVTPAGEVIAGSIIDDWETYNAALIAPL